MLDADSDFGPSPVGSDRPLRHQPVLRFQPGDQRTEAILLRKLPVVCRLMRGAGPYIAAAVAPVGQIFEIASVLGLGGREHCRSDETVPAVDPDAALVTVEPLKPSVSAGFGRPARVLVLLPRLVRLILPDLPGFSSFFLLPPFFFGEALPESLRHRRINEVTLGSGESGPAQSTALHGRGPAVQSHLKLIPAPLNINRLVQLQCRQVAAIHLLPKRSAEEEIHPFDFDPKKLTIQHHT